MEKVKTNQHLQKQDYFWEVIFSCWTNSKKFAKFQRELP